MSGVASGSRYAPLSVEEEHDSEQESNGNTPIPSRLPSPTPTLQPVLIPTTWTFEDVEYANLDDFLRHVSGTGDGEAISQQIRIITNLATGISTQATATSFNTLGNKIYEHVNGQHCINLVLEKQISTALKAS